ncbi:hypothetical protein GCM10018777_08170 [Streptomyces albogriseolus]|uniref:hypothetical protein n=1 Tax=Streptomyces albogriseolus TaxID=1887 RepID=UPI00167776BD|nr:hypothetical protein [Streptomyces viridodiastaticus]GHF99996.1 hypothetical protein GCM10018777_08170 [Streptomyces viridodiastaticus]
MDPADAYVELYDLLTLCSGSSLADWSREDETLALIDQVCCEVLAQGELPDGWMPAELPQQSDQPALRRCLGILLGLDSALDSAALETDVLPYDELRYLRYRMRLHGRLNQATSGSLVVRRARPFRPSTAAQNLADLLSFIRIPSHVSARVQIHVVTSVNDLPDLEPVISTDPELEPLPPIPVAQMPMLADGEDLVWEKLDRPAGQFYTVAPKTTRLRERILDALTALDDSDAVLGLLPEACIDDSLAREWQEVLRNHPPPSHSRLTWLLIGTGPLTRSGGLGLTDRRPNRAVLLTRAGKVLMTQDKQHGFTFTAGQQQTYGVTALGHTTRDEHIDSGTDFRALESRYGRFGLNICEDLGRHDVQSDVIASGVTHLMVPVLAAAMHDKGWQAQAAQTLVIEAGTAVAVTNGLAINRYVPATYGGGPAPTLVAIKAPTGHPTEYPGLSDMVREYACPKTAISAKQDALTPRTADW